MSSDAVGNVDAGRPVFRPLGRVPFDVEPLRIWKVLSQEVRGRQGEEHVRARRNPVARKRERVRHPALKSERDRMDPQGLHHESMCDIELREPRYAWHPVGKERIRLGPHLLEEVRSSQRLVQHEHARKRGRVEPPEEEEQEVGLQVLFGKELRVFPMKFKQVVHHVRRSISTSSVFPQCHDLVEVGPQAPAGTRNPRVLQPQPRAAPRDVDCQRPPEEEVQVTREIDGGDVGTEYGGLANHHALKGRTNPHRPCLKPAVHLRSGNAHEVHHALLKVFGGEARSHRLAQPSMLGTFHGIEELRCAQAATVVLPLVDRSQMGSSPALQELSSCRPGQDEKTTVQRTHAKDRPQFRVLLGEERVHIACHAESATEKRQTLDLGNLTRVPGRLRRLGGATAVPNRRNQGTPDQVEPTDQLDSISQSHPLGGRQQTAHDATGVAQADEHYVARGGNLVTEQHPHEPQSDFLDRTSITGGIAARPQDATGKEEAVRPVLENAAFNQASDRALTDLPAPRRRAGTPEVRVAVARTGRDVRQSRIEKIIVHGRRIHQNKPLEVGVDPSLQRQFHQHGAGDDDVQQTRRVGRRQVAVLLVQHQKEGLLHDPDHLAQSHAPGLDMWATVLAPTPWRTAKPRRETARGREEEG